VHGMQDTVVIQGLVVLAEAAMGTSTSSFPESVHDCRRSHYVARHVPGRSSTISKGTWEDRNDARRGPGALPSGPEHSLTVEQLASLPRFGHRAPSSPVWSPMDGRRVS
jgi:hypothetical protein